MASFQIKGRKLLLLAIISFAALMLGGITWRLVPVNAEVPGSEDDCWDAEYYTYYPPQGMDNRFGPAQQIKPALVRKDTGTIQQPSAIAKYSSGSWTDGQSPRLATPDGEVIAPSAGNDILANGGFEDDADTDGLPDNWNVSIPDGEFGIAIGIVGNPEGRNVAIFKPSMKTFLIFQDVIASPRQSYEFTGFINITNAFGWFRLSVALIPLNEQGQPLASFELANHIQPTSGWVRLSKTVVTPSYTSKLRVQAKVDVMRATAYLDDFKLKAVSP